MELKTHTEEDLVKFLVSRLKEELTDVDTYNSLYELFEMRGMYDEAEDIEDIARDEFKHAEILSDILEEHGYDLHSDQDIKTLWHKAKKAFNVT